jgi:hypothetical protein
LLALALFLSACGGEVVIGQPRGTAVIALVEPTATPTLTPTATPTPTPTVTPTLPPVPTPTPVPPTAPARTATTTPRPAASRVTNSAIRDFSAWDEGESDPPGRYTRAYDAATGEYAIAILEEEQEWSFYSPDTTQHQDFRLEVEARRTGGPDGTGYGLVFRRQERQANQQTSERYIFYVTAQGFYSFFYVASDNKVTRLKDITPAPNTVRVGDATNTLAVICSGATIRLLVNDQEVYRANNLALVKPGDIGIFALSPQNGQTTRINYKNIALTTP